MLQGAMLSAVERNQFSSITLLAVIYIAGAISLIIEIVALRVLAPYFGNTIFVTSSVISIILAALAIGYYLGGRLSDRRPDPRVFFALIAAAGVLVVLIVSLAAYLLPLLGRQLTIISGPPVAALALFFLPGLMFGMLPPFALRLLIDPTSPRAIGETAGKVFFWSTAGSICGSLLAAYGLIPFFHTNTIFLASGLLLVIIGIFGQYWHQRIVRSVVAQSLLLLFLVFGAISIEPTRASLLYDRNGTYEHITIFEAMYRGQLTRFLSLDQNNSSAQYVNSDEHVFGYTQYYQLYKLLPAPAQKTLVLGGGAYTIPASFIRELPDVTVDVVDIEPQLYPLSQKYFQLEPNNRLRNHVTDGRRFLADSREQYDFIFSDVYYSLHAVPAHFTTKEFFELVKSRLAPDGMFVANLIGTLSGGAESFVPAEIKTFAEVFTNAAYFAVTDPSGSDVQNIMLVGLNGDRDLFQPAELAQSTDEFLGSLPFHRIDPAQLDLSRSPVLTDSYAPVEYMMAKTLLRSR